MALKAKMVGREALTRKLRDLSPSIEKEYGGAIETGAKELATAIRGRAPRDTGEYAASIDAARVSDAAGRQQVGMQATKDPNAWGVVALYIWRFIEFGTKAHVIKARRGGRLSFEASDGTRVSAKQVTHPGTPAHPHIFPTYRQYRKRIRARVARAVNKAIRKATGN